MKIKLTHSIRCFDKILQRTKAKGDDEVFDIINQQLFIADTVEKLTSLKELVDTRVFIKSWYQRHGYYESSYRKK